MIVSTAEEGFDFGRGDCYYNFIFKIISLLMASNNVVYTQIEGIVKLTIICNRAHSRTARVIYGLRGGKT